MQEITMGYIVISFITGFVIGFVSWIFDDARIIGLFQIGGIVTAYVFISAVFPTPPPTLAQLNTTQFVDSTTQMMYYLVYFTIGDAAGSAGSLFFKRGS